MKDFSKRSNANLLVTTSRRTPKDVERLIKNELADFPHCKILIIANERNTPEAIGAILGLSKSVIVTPESISMISEAVSSRRHTVVVKPQNNLGKRHQRFLENFADKRYIYLTDVSDIGQSLEKILDSSSAVKSPKDNLLVKQALEKML